MTTRELNNHSKMLCRILGVHSHDTIERMINRMAKCIERKKKKTP